MRRRARLWREICSVRSISAAAILVNCSVRDWTRFLRHRIRNYPESPTRYRIRCEFTYFHFEGRIYFFPDSLPNSPDACYVDGSRIRKEKVAVSKISGYVWTGPCRTSRASLLAERVSSRRRKAVWQWPSREERRTTTEL